MLKMKIVVISDSFKGSLSSGEIVDIFNNVKDDKHLKLVLRDDKSLIDVVGFSMGQRRDEIRIGDKIDIVGTIELNTYNTPKTIQFEFSLT